MTETLEPRFRDLDLWPLRTALDALWEGQLAAVAALGPALPALASAAEAAAKRLREERARLCYAGAGSSARVAVADGSELPPTYGWPESRLHFLVAGGERALLRPVEGAEDDPEAARSEVHRLGLSGADVLVAVAASGGTPYTLAAAEEARRRGALVVGIANAEGSPLLRAAHHPVFLPTGPEVPAGSTRMKAGTAQKAALNLLSTAVMIRLGGVHDGMMVGMRPLNAKLRLRATGIVARIASCTEDRAARALEASGGSIKAAILIAGAGLSPEEADRRLSEAGGRLREALSPRRSGGP
ncbi:N-acetylmuramic acid 6-phosphate etherase [Rubellimicrobium sp. CFH 75288]|uniref:N-acetylmuramic acid 6-phosphate etherase n=1 Tax=Rubellimicrobium sp. CFH 75288 TaxID=2697034 RepID=UPI00141361E5|nr:N-acetylmuramic acid 6-phosphate etherase [Rubellimicrobium sp. CFH 75288]NAZ35321.1 N-acetylmuramic acid 6-phosphate etherase [Rubellimicrobium sp. CFH 75288]